MDKNGLFLAALLDSASRAYAAGVATRELEEMPDLDGKVGFSELSAEAELRIRLLAESVAAGRPLLFASEVAWLKVLYASRDQDWKHLEIELSCLEKELLDRLPPASSGPISEHVDAARRHLAEAPTTVPGFLQDDQAPGISLARHYLLAILEGRASDAVAVITNAAESGTPLHLLHDQVIVPVQSEIGRMWHMGEIHVGEEHLGTQATRDALTLLRARIPDPPPGARKVLAAGTPRAAHGLGLRMAADRLRIAGWEPVVLGADIPPADCVRSALDHEVDLVAISVPMVLNIRKAHELTTEIKERAKVPVVLGGRPLRLVDDLWQVIGADAGAPTAQDVVHAADRLVPTRS